jgi:hypothetical protein
MWGRNITFIRHLDHLRRAMTDSWSPAAYCEDPARSQASLCNVCGEWSGAGAGSFLWVLLPVHYTNLQSFSWQTDEALGPSNKNDLSEIKGHQGIFLLVFRYYSFILLV